MIKRLLLILPFALAAKISAMDIVYSKHRDASEFKRISEHFSGEENPGRYTIVRTQSNRRVGHYIALRLEESDNASRYAKVRIQLIKPGSDQVEKTDLPISSVNTQRILVGLTDAFWESDKVVPIAWKIDFLDSSNTVVGSAKSFLWSLD